MNVLITAGGIPTPEDSLYEITKGGYKSLIPLAGKPIIQWILDAFSRSRQIGEIVIVGLPSDTPLICSHPIHFIPDHGDMILNTRSGLDELRRIDPKAEYSIMCAGDVPALTPEMVDWLLAAIPTLDADLLYTIVERQVMEKTFPDSNRTFLHLKDKEVCGGDIFAIRMDPFVQHHPIWDKLVASRKKPLKQAAMFGFDTLLLVLTRQLTVKSLEERVSNKLGLKGRTLLSPFAELGMDVDKLFQLEIVKKFLINKRAG